MHGILQDAEDDGISLPLQELRLFPVTSLICVIETDEQFWNDIIEAADKTITTISQTGKCHLITARIYLEILPDLFLDPEDLMVSACRILDTFLLSSVASPAREAGWITRPGSLRLGYRDI
jgi:hypothetical protein